MEWLDRKKAPLLCRCRCSPLGPRVCLVITQIQLAGASGVRTRALWPRAAAGLLLGLGVDWGRLWVGEGQGTGRRVCGLLLNCMHVITLAEGEVVGFKAAAGVDASELCADRGGQADWSAVYPQLSLARAMHYLTNQFERGHEEACLLLLRVAPGTTLRVAVCTAEELADGTLSAADKAALVREEAISAGVLPTPSLPSQHDSADVGERPPLMHAFGEADTALCLPDARADEFELVVPHALMRCEGAEADEAEGNVRFQADVLLCCRAMGQGMPLLGSVRAATGATPELREAVEAALQTVDVHDVVAVGDAITQEMERRGLGTDTQATWSPTVSTS